CDRQQPLQIDLTILSTLASSRSTAGLPVPSAGPFILWPRPRPPDDGSAVPSEFVPGALALEPNAPPPTDAWCMAMPAARANAMDEIHRPTDSRHRMNSFFMKNLPAGNTTIRLMRRFQPL